GRESAQTTLDRDGGTHRIGRMAKDGAEGISHCLENLTAARLDGVPERGIMASERTTHRLGLSLPEPCAALDIREQERDSPAGQFSHLMSLCTTCATNTRAMFRGPARGFLRLFEGGGAGGLESERFPGDKTE